MTRISGPDLKNKLAADIVVAFLHHGNIPIESLPNLVRQVRAALNDNAPSLLASEPIDGGVETRYTTVPDIRPDTKEVLTRSVPLRPAIPVEQSIQRDYLVSLEDGKHYRSLRRHLMSKYGMTPDDYRAKWSLPNDYPMVAPSYAEERSAVAKRIGLGRLKQTGEIAVRASVRRKSIA